MKLKSWVLWVLVVAFFASEIFLFSANRQKSAALAASHEYRQKVEDLQAQLGQLQDSNAGSQSAEFSKLRADNLDLPRLRSEVSRLQADNEKLSQQLKVALAATQQQQDQLQQLAAENQEARAAAQQAAADTERDACINNLRQIDAAKQQWALENSKTAEAIPSAQDLQPYFKGGVFPVCPSGGAYTIGAVGDVPACSLPGHVLPQ